MRNDFESIVSALRESAVGTDCEIDEHETDTATIIRMWTTHQRTGLKTMYHVEESKLADTPVLVMADLYCELPNGDRDQRFPSIIIAEPDAELFIDVATRFQANINRMLREYLVRGDI